MEDKEKPKSKTGTIIGFGLMAFVLFFLASMWIPGLTRYRPKQFCQKAESEAHTIAAAIADYFSVAEHTDIARSDIEKLVLIDNPWTFFRCGDNFFIHVFDRSGKCPAGKQPKDPDEKTGLFNGRSGDCPAVFQYNDPNWNSGAFTLKVMSKPISKEK